MSPTFTPCSQGLKLLAIRVRTIRLWCRPMVLKVSVGQVSSVSMIRPKGTSPSLIRAWNPLQMPHMRPSRFSSRSVTASFTASPRKKAVMNLALPSGSSPPLKPPGMKMIWDSRISLAKVSTLRAMPSARRG